MEKVRGAQVRARTKWVEDGDKSTKYCCSLEKARGTQNIITRRQKPDGEIVTSQGQLLQEQASCYRGLFNQAPEEEHVREAAGRVVTTDLNITG